MAQRSTPPPRETPASKVCAKCKQDLPAAAFGRDPRMASGLKSYCRKCLNQTQRNAWYADHENQKAASRTRARRRYDPERRRRESLQHRFGMTAEQFAELLEMQGGRCGICKTDEPGGRGTWHVDHDHSCCPGKRSCGQCVRGLLCNRCNVGLGMFLDRPDVIARAILYVKGELA